VTVKLASIQEVGEGINAHCVGLEGNNLAPSFISTPYTPIFPFPPAHGESFIAFHSRSIQIGFSLVSTTGYASTGWMCHSLSRVDGLRWADWVGGSTRKEREGERVIMLSSGGGGSTRRDHCSPTSPLMLLLPRVFTHPPTPTSTHAHETIQRWRLLSRVCDA